MVLMMMDLVMSRKLGMVMFITLDLLVHTVDYEQVKVSQDYMHIIHSFHFQDLIAEAVVQLDNY